MKNKRQIVRSEILPFHEECLMGIPVILKDAAIAETDSAGDETVTIPDMEALVAAIAVNRCLEPRKLAGGEIRFMRKALGMTQADFAETLEIDPATVSRWENDGQVLDRCWAGLPRNVCVTLFATRFTPNFHTSTTTPSAFRT